MPFKFMVEKHLLTAEEMAKELRISVKTFYKRVRRYSIPFIDSGQKLFDPEKVWRSLETTMGVAAIPSSPASNRRPTVLPNKKYRELLGL